MEEIVEKEREEKESKRQRKIGERGKREREGIAIAHTVWASIFNGVNFPLGLTFLGLTFRYMCSTFPSQPELSREKCETARFFGHFARQREIHGCTWKNTTDGHRA